MPKKKKKTKKKKTNTKRGLDRLSQSQRWQRAAPKPEFSWEVTDSWPLPLLREVGIALMEARTVKHAIVDSEGNVTEPYHVDYAPISVRVMDHVFTCNPRYITVNEVSELAQKNCPVCKGEGKYADKQHIPIQVTKDDGTIVNTTTKREIVATCGCANRRYKRAHKSILIDERLGEWVALDDIQANLDDEAINLRKELIEKISEWEKGDQESPLHDHLGMTAEKYGEFRRRGIAALL